MTQISAVSLESPMKHTSTTARLSLVLSFPHDKLCKATVRVPASIVDSFFHQAALCQQRLSVTPGFIRGSAPLDYIKENFCSAICEHVQHLLLKYAIIGFLYEEIRMREILLAGQPRLNEISLQPNADAFFNFDLSIVPSIPIAEWKYLPFKAPKRKNYKDLDRQVETFLKDEKTLLDGHENCAIGTGDWINFDLLLCSSNECSVVEGFSQNFWFKVGADDTESPLREDFIGKKCGDSFFSRNRGLQEYFSSRFETDYLFRITITDHIPYAYFCVEQFKKYFRLKTTKETHKKLIEVFSYRNDISQRRSMVEESLKLMISRHMFEVPSYVVLRQQKDLMEMVRHNPDFHVYQSQKDFRHRIRQLAEKQSKEKLFVDGLAYHEKITVCNQDVRQYLNLMNRPRTKEFIYFDMPPYKMQGQEVPILSEELKRLCLREKAINHAIYHLTKK